MKLSEFLRQVIKLGRERDPRSNKKRIKGYADTAILYGNPNKEIRKLLIGIDIEAAELLLADRLRQRQGLDLVISHHPEGKAYCLLHEVMQLQVDILRQAGVNALLAQKLLDERKEEVARKILPQNHTRPVDAARLLDLPFMCMHTPADNHAFWFIKKLMDRKRPKKVRDVLNILGGVPEYKKAAEFSAGPRLVLGSLQGATGKILVEMTGGTEGSRDIYEKLSNAGIKTVIAMHLSEEHFKKAKDANLNVIIAGHISSDTLGINLLLDRVEEASGEVFQVINCSGFHRVKRN